METELQRRWQRARRNGTIGSGGRRGSRANDSERELDIYDKLRAGLDKDLHIVPPEVYEKNKRLFDSIKGVGYLLRDPNRPGTLDWAWAGSLDRVVARFPGIEILNKVYIVRVRTPWNTVNTEWCATKGEIEEFGEDYEIIDTVLMARPKDSNISPIIISKRAYSKYKDQLELVDVAYLVQWATPETPRTPIWDMVKSMNIDKKTFTRVLSI